MLSVIYQINRINGAVATCKNRIGFGIACYLSNLIKIIMNPLTKINHQKEIIK